MQKQVLNETPSEQPSLDVASLRSWRGRLECGQGAPPDLRKILDDGLDKPENAESVDFRGLPVFLPGFCLWVAVFLV